MLHPSGVSSSCGGSCPASRELQTRLSTLAVEYDRRFLALSGALRTSSSPSSLTHDAALHTLRRSESTSLPFGPQRVEELMRTAVEEEREQALKRALGTIAEQQARIEALETKVANAAATASTITSSSMHAASFELAHRSQLTSTHASAHIARLESALRDAHREVEIARQSETVYRDQLAGQQEHALHQSRQLELVLKQHAELQLQHTCVEEQMALARAHASEAELAAQLASTRFRARLSGREKELADENAAMRAQMNTAAQESLNSLQLQLQRLQSQEAANRMVALHEQHEAHEDALRQTEDTWRDRVATLERELRDLEQAYASEADKVRAVFSAERSSLLEAQAHNAQRSEAAHAAFVTDLKHTTRLELEQAQERIAQLLEAQNTARDQREEGLDRAAAQRRQLEVQLDARFAEAQSLNRTLADQVTTLQNQLSVAAAVKAQMDQAASQATEEWASLRQRHNELTLHFQSTTQSSSHTTAQLQATVVERDALRAKYLQLGEKMESVITSVEAGMASSASEERSKRAALKQQYADERTKWKQEKHALMETISLQERKNLDLAAVVRTAEERLETAKTASDALKADVEKERHTAALNLTQLQQDVLTLQAHRKSLEGELQTSRGEVERLVLQRGHAADLNQAGAESTDLKALGARTQADGEFTLKMTNLKHELEAMKQEHRAALHKKDLEHEMAKTQLWAEASQQMEAKLAEVRSSLLNGDQVELAVKAKLEELKTKLGSTLIHPHQHEATLVAKLEALRAQMRLERDQALHDASTRHAAALVALETKHALREEETKAKHLGEFTLFTENLREQMADGEERARRERTVAMESTKMASKTEAALREAETRCRDLTSHVEEHQRNEARFLSHISAQARVIEQLKAMVDTEKTRLIELPANERARFREHAEQQAQQAAQDRADLVKHHQAAQDDLRTMLEAEKKLIRELHEQRDQRDREHREREETLQVAHRAASSTALARASEQLVSLEAQHKALWIAREKEWTTEVESRESLLTKRVQGWEESYKTALATREHKLIALGRELEEAHERTRALEAEQAQLHGQLRDSAEVLELQTQKMARVGAQVRLAENLRAS